MLENFSDFAVDVLDFDEFMVMCREIGAEPVLCVAADEYLVDYPEGCTWATRDELIEHAVEWVRYAGLDDNPDRPLVDKYMGGRASSILSFGISGGREAGARFIDALQLAVRLVNIGDAKTLACHPATTTHRQLGPEEAAKAGVSDDMVRLSVGIEHIDDIIEDLDQALASSSA